MRVQTHVEMSQAVSSVIIYLFPFYKDLIGTNYAPQILYSTVRNIDRVRTQPETPGTSLVFGYIRFGPTPHLDDTSRDYRSNCSTWREIVCRAGNPLVRSRFGVTATYLYYVISGQGGSNYVPEFKF